MLRTEINYTHIKQDVVLINTNPVTCLVFPQQQIPFTVTGFTSNRKFRDQVIPKIHIIETIILNPE